MSDLTQRWLSFYQRHVERGEFEFFMTRNEAEDFALECCVAKWRDINHEETSPETCCHCKGPETAQNPTLPFGKSFWLHSDCWPAWSKQREAMAEVELKKILNKD